MRFRAERRVSGGHKAVLIVDDGEDTVRQADPGTLRDLLTDMPGLAARQGAIPTETERRNAVDWRQLIISRAATGEIITMDPERFGDGVYRWFRSRGVDYDTPEENRRGPIEWIEER